MKNTNDQWEQREQQLEAEMKYLGFNVNLKGSLSKVDFVQALAAANKDGVFAFGDEDYLRRRDCFKKWVKGKQLEEVLDAWDHGYSYKANN